MENIPFSKISVVGNERRYLDEVLQSGHLSSDGAFCRRCEAWLSDNLSGASVLMTNSGTAALDLAAAAMGLEPGDEVIMPSFTFVSTANAVCRLGAIPKFVDVSPGTMNMDADLVEAAITPRTRAIFPVHYAGIGCAPDRITDIAARHELTVVEDAAQGLCATFDGRPLGTFGAMAAFSFHEQKNVGCGEAGALVINDPAALDRAHVIRDKGTNRRAFFPRSCLVIFLGRRRRILWSFRPQRGVFSGAAGEGRRDHADPPAHSGRLSRAACPTCGAGAHRTAAYPR